MLSNEADIKTFQFANLDGTLRCWALCIVYLSLISHVPCQSELTLCCDYFQMKQKRKQSKKEGKGQEISEDDDEKVTRQMFIIQYYMTMNDCITWNIFTWSMYEPGSNFFQCALKKKIDLSEILAYVLATMHNFTLNLIFMLQMQILSRKMLHKICVPN